MTLCGWNVNGRRDCQEPGTVEIPEGPRFLCPRHAVDLVEKRAAAEARARAARLRGLG